MGRARAKQPHLCVPPPRAVSHRGQGLTVLVTSSTTPKEPSFDSALQLCISRIHSTICTANIWDPLR